MGSWSTRSYLDGSEFMVRGGATSFSTRFIVALLYHVAAINSLLLMGSAIAVVEGGYLPGGRAILIGFALMQCAGITLTIVAIVHALRVIWRSNLVSKKDRDGWTAAVLLVGPVALPAFWWNYVRGEASHRPFPP